MYFILDGLLHEDFSNRWTFEFIPFFSFRTDILLVGDVVFPSQMASQTIIVGKKQFTNGAGDFFPIWFPIRLLVFQSQMAP